MKKCKCKKCKKEFNKGEQADNEEFCLRCERELLIEEINADGYEIEDFEYRGNIEE